MGEENNILEGMKYTVTALYLGQLILNQPITEALFDAFCEEGESSDVLDLAHAENNIFISRDLIDELRGAISINNLGVRQYAVSTIADGISRQYDKVESVLDNEGYRDFELMPGESTTMKVREVKDGKTFFDVEHPSSVTKFLQKESYDSSIE